MKKIILTLGFVFPLIAGDIMVDRMQSVVDEVSELRKRYEDSVYKNEQCLSQVKEKNKILSQKGLSPLVNAKNIEALEFENTRLKEAQERVKQENVRFKELEPEVSQLNKENKRLNISAQILVNKNQSLLEQLNKLKRNKEESESSFVIGLKKEKKRLIKELSLSEKIVQKLEKINTDLEEKLQDSTSSSISNASALASFGLLQEKNKKLLENLKTCENFPKTYVKRVKNSKSICIDDNPFPKLLKKEKKIEPKKAPKTLSPLIEDIKISGVYRIKGESAVYDKPMGIVIEIWEDTRSFTSNISKDNWVKITGFFVDRKWRKAKSNMWVESKDTSER